MTKNTAQSDRRVGPHIRGTFRALETVLSRALNGLGVRYSHFQVLNILWNKDGLTQGAIATASYITDSSLAQVLNEMVSKGLVERRRDADDGRKRLVFLTSKGASLEKKATSAVLEIMDVALIGVSDKDISQLISTHMKIRQNINDQFNLRLSNVQTKKTA